MIGKVEKCKDLGREFRKQGWPEAKSELGALCLSLDPCLQVTFPLCAPSPPPKDLRAPWSLTCDST